MLVWCLETRAELGARGGLGAWCGGHLLDAVVNEKNDTKAKSSRSACVLLLR